MVLQSFGGEPVPVEHSLALQAELAARAGKQLGGRGLKRAHDEPAEPRGTSMCPTPLTLSAVLWRAWGSPG